MQKIFDFLYKLNNECDITDDFIIEVYGEILNIKEREKSSIFISTLFTYLIMKRRDSEMIIKLLNKSFEKDSFKPFHYIISPKKTPVISLAGSGKKGIKTINVSTTSAIIAVSLGANILKSCSSATSSLTGSFDLMELLGINTNLTIEDTIQLLDKTRIWTIQN